ncbi:tyrosine-type recombinase/integrase [Thioalkalivibrio sp. K90mix]|uniref:tyrosine-type recombinase/integrase n=1 Tax=Thioalkalivibrio sp. (strain K90mix) TaxID=396595 RepID=UPI001FCAF319|nr:tyrosine-type recombinase/integrase [Thioalkalivibrio sp. K90mix]
MRVIRDLLSFLAQAGYLIGNPLALINICAHAHNESVAVQRARAPRRRALGRRLWIRLQSAVNNWPEKTPQAQFEKARARWMLTLMYALGPRISDLRGSFGDIHREAVGDRDLWIWSIAGKGGKFAQLPLPSPVVDEMVRFRKSIGIPAFPVDGETTPLVPRSTDTNRNRPLTRQGLDRIVRQTLDSAAQQAYDDGDPEAAERLSRASAHALRHTAATDILESGVDMRVAADLMRHSDIRTTQGYTTPELSRLMDALDQRDLEWRDH